MLGMKAAVPLCCALALGLVGGAPGASGRAAGGRSVVVPRVTGSYDLLHAYRRLHRAGLAMSILKPFSLSSLCLPSPHDQSPAPGARVAAGATVSVRWLACALGSPAGGQAPVVVPDLTGQSARAAVAGAERAGLYWQLDRLAPLAGGSSRPELLDNYVVTDQVPAAGSMLARGTDCSTGGTPCFRVTPVRLRARLVRG
ncbi:MAG: hypothetical protein QOF77_446 [Solirubrobacteraceae bacterium]|jgi:hypothetical protein|nr:hypothetical protein [Solirubrobacteraceae bacterium]